MKTIHLSSNNAELGVMNQISIGGSKKPLPPSSDYIDKEWLNETLPSQSLAQSHQQSTKSGLTRSRTVQSLSASSASTVSSSHGSSLSLLQKEESQGSSTTDSSGRTECSTFSSSCSSSSSSVPTPPLPSPDFTTFGMDLRRHTFESPNVPVFDGGMRKILEPHMRKARISREESRRHRWIILQNVHDSIASSVGVPYVRLRSERPFLYDTYTHPMHQVLAETLGVDDLSQLHRLSSSSQHSLDRLIAPLLCRETRIPFQESYDTFVTSFCIPLLHSMAMSHNLFHGIHSASQNTRISYRYQAFPNISVVRPGDASAGPHCDTSKGHNVAYLHFHIPLTPSYGTNALYTESHPGREDWHPLQTKSTGMGFLIDGARCLHFFMENTTDSTMVALDFVVAIYCNNDGDDQHPMVDPHGLCNHVALEDAFSLSGPGFYEEAVIDIRPGSPLWQVVAKKRDGKHKLLDPDARNGFPFSQVHH
jgi:hypothetical protein